MPWVEWFHELASGRARGLRSGVQRGLLTALSLPYSWAVRIRNRLYDLGWKASHRAPVPVVSVGNLTLGGTGKTPCVEYVAAFYRRRGLRPAILSRGYGASDGRNDEFLVLEENLPDVPHLQGTDRVQLAAVACEELESDILILDDGFQHRRLARDLDIVVIDATNPWGFGRLFPRGLLREPPAGLGRAHIIVLTRCNQATRPSVEEVRRRIACLAPGRPVVQSVHLPEILVNSERATRPITDLIDRPVAAFAGIGNPEGFRRTLADLGARLRAFRGFPDHHVYTRRDVEDLRAWARQLPADGLVLTTQKDLVKLQLNRLAERELWALRIRLHLTWGQELLDRKLEEAVSGG
ncbi:MAG: tetraacyldisaccharide 4'-kinase [Gemmataceae bacterium]|nr:tetraacyldisaccharide 4'-kinase [Gemmataceae bacterium]MDW8266195.1 tetraacyldisaccharide 4'-kinase [Gemmataceae bacterium]